MNNTVINQLMDMSAAEISNYIVPGLSSHLLGETYRGKVRMFQATREQHEHIVPHSHRFDFSCLVLRGHVKNTIWKEAIGVEQNSADPYCVTTIEYGGTPGKYTRRDERQAYFLYDSSDHCAGEWYSMSADQIHSIRFSRGTLVLFFEGARIRNTSLILEPFVNGKRVETFKVEDWMFEHHA